MDVRLAAVLASRTQGGRVNVSAVCRELDISRDTYYRLLRRFGAGGLESVLTHQSRRPRSSPGRVGADVEDRIVFWRKRLLEDGLDAGARSIRFAMQREGAEGVPAAATIHRVLRRHGLVVDEPAKRPKAADMHRFEYPAPNACWQIDGTEWPLADGTIMKIIRVVDDHSRRVVASRVAASENIADTWACVQAGIGAHGAPALVLSDRGSALNGAPGRASTFRANLAALGIATVAARARHPQTCGKNERSHQTLQRWLRRQPPAATAAELQAQVDSFDEIYNSRRPHQALAGATPDERYLASPKAGPAGRLDPAPASAHQLLVSARGAIRISEFDIQLGRRWQGVTVTALRQGDNVAVFHGAALVRQLTLDTTRRYQRNHGHRGKRQPRVLSAMS